MADEEEPLLPDEPTRFPTAAGLRETLVEQERVNRITELLASRFTDNKTWDADFEELPTSYQEHFEDVGRSASRIADNPHGLAVLLACATAEGVRHGLRAQSSGK